MMGKVKSKVVKRIAREIMNQYADRVSTDFEENKKLTNEVIELPKKLRNQVAGYLTRLARISKRS